MSRTKNLLGNRYGNLIVTKHLGKDSSRGALWQCLCDCGETVVVKSTWLLNGGKSNCGCIKKRRPKIIDTRSRTYHSYSHMKDRCNNPSADCFENYGGRGITVCDRWLEGGGKGFLNFLADMGERPEGLTLDRENVDGNYEPSNCRWADWGTQTRNKRKHKENKSGFTGIHWNILRKKWHVQFRTKDKTFYLGLYDDLDRAKEIRQFVENLYNCGILTTSTSLSEIRNRLWG